MQEVASRLGKEAIFTDGVGKIESGQDMAAFVELAMGVCANNIGVAMNKLMGDNLTLAEVAVPEGKQLNALKSQLRSAINRARAEMREEVLYVSRQLIAGLSGTYPGELGSGAIPDALSAPRACFGALDEE